MGGFAVNRVMIISIPLIVFFTVIIFHPDAFCESPSLMKGIEQYKQENYEEAIEFLKRAREEDKNSSSAAFFLGLAYKQVLDYKKALEHLRDAVTLSPRIKEALVELIAVSYQLFDPGNLEEAKRWIKIAEEQEIFPARIAFLKGLILQKEGHTLEAVESFEKAKALDQTLAQSADLQIALCYVKERRLKEAQDRFQSAIRYDPGSDLATFARQYQDLVEKRIFLERPIRFTLGLFGQYDTNVVLKPVESALAPDITDEASRAFTTTLRVDYVPILKGPWLFNAQYAFSGNFHDKHATSHDVITNSIYVAPGYNFGRSALNLPISYSHALVRGPSYKKYVGSLNVGPLYRRLLQQKHILELFAGYSLNEYFRPPSAPEEDRDSTGLNTYASWIWVFKEESFFNLKYEFTDNKTDGRNWENNGHRFSLNATVPLIDKLKFQLSGQAHLQDYKHTHTVFETKRDDETYQASLGLIWEFFKNTNLILQYNKSRSDSNIAIYDYKRDLYTIGIEYRF